MKFTYSIEVDVERVTGKFVGRDELSTTISEALESALGDLDLTGLGADGDSEYDVDSSDVSETEQPKAQPRSNRPTERSRCGIHGTPTESGRCAECDAAVLCCKCGTPVGFDPTVRFNNDADRAEAVHKICPPNEALLLAREAADELARCEPTPGSNEAQLVAAFTTIDEALAKGGTLPAAWAEASS